MTSLIDSRKMFVDATASLSERWSVAEIAEHLALSEDRIFDGAIESLKINNRDPGAKQPTDDEVMKFMTDRSIKAQAPAGLQPHQIARFLASRDRNIAYLRDTHDDLRHHYTEGPLGLMDAYQTIIGMSGHSEKHVGQMRDAMGSRGFPKK